VRDALVRDSHRVSLAPPGNFNRLDEAVVRRTMLAEAARLIGRGVVTAVTITSQTPARLAGTPPRSPAGRTLIP
jgi:hypothetical protein